MVDKNNIKKKEDAIADSTLYNGRKLEAVEKLIFDHDDIKNDLTKIRDTAEILEKVIRAKEENKKNSTLLSELKGYKRNNPDSIKAINEKNSSQFNIAVTSLESFETPTGDEATLQQQIREIDGQVAAYKSKIDRNNKKVKNANKEAVEAERKMKNFETKKVKMTTLFRPKLVGLELFPNSDQFSGNINTDAYKDNGTEVNQHLINALNYYNNQANGPVAIFNSKIRYSATHRRFITATQLRNVGYQIFDMMRGDDFKNALFAYIDSSSFSFSSFTSPTANVNSKKDLKDAWEDLLKCKWASIGGGSGFRYEFLKKDTNGEVIQKYDPFAGKNSIVGWPDGSDSTKPAIYPFHYFDFVKFIKIMKAIFPDNNLSNNLLLKESSAIHLPDDFLIDKGKKDFTITLAAFTEDITPTGSDHKQALLAFKWIKENKPDQEKFLIPFTVPETDFAGILQYFWDAGFDDASQTSGTNLKWTIKDDVYGDEVERKVLKELILWIKKVKKQALENDGIDVSEKMLSDMALEIIKDYKRQRKEAGSAPPADWKEKFMITAEEVPLKVFKLNKNITTVALPTTALPNSWQRYLSIEVVDEHIYELERLMLEQKQIKEANEAYVAKYNSENANYQLEIDDLEEEKKTIEEQIAILKIKDLPTAKAEFDTVYKDGPLPSGTTKYSIPEIMKMFTYLKRIGELMKEKPEPGITLDPATDLDPTYLGYHKKLTDLQSSLKDWEVIVTNYQSCGNDGKERANNLSEEQLNKAKEAFGKLDELRLLSVLEKSQYEDVKKGKSISGSDTPPPSNLKIDQLVEALKGTKELKESDLMTLTAWQATTKFREKKDIEDLVKDYKSGATGADNFKKHLAEGKTGEKIDGDGYWEEFVKKEPNFVIGAIKHYEYENSLGDYKDKTKRDEVLTKMGDANKYESDDKKEVADDTWNKDKAADMVEFLYRLADDKKGKELVKSVKTKTIDEKDEDKEKNTSWFKFGDGNYRPFITYGVGFVVIIAAGMAIFWKNISDWWNGPAEEEGAGADESEKEEVEEK